MSDHEIWQYSATTEESWSDDERNGEDEWPLSGIVGEEVNMTGDIKYEVAWLNWKRSDGTNTTWMPDIYDRQDIVNSWKRKQNKMRRDRVEESLDITVRHDLDICNTNTIRRAEAFSEKLDRRNRRAVGYKKWDLELEKNLDRLDREMGVGSHSRSLRVSSTRTNEFPHPRAASVAPSVISISDSVSSSTGSKGPSVSQSNLPGSSSSRPATLSSASSKAASSAANRRSMTSQAPGIESRPSRPLPRRAAPLTPTMTTPPRRSALQAAWDKATRKIGAAPVFIVNDIDNEEVPDLVPDFKYYENTYVYSAEVLEPNMEYLIGCECVECLSVSGCDCQLSSDRNDPEETFAYVDGLFTFELPQGTEVIECNELCSCDSSCPNRVAQQPRQFQIEIFKTKNCGWGARATVAIERGRVLGVYTGKLIRRTAAETLPEGHSGYLFDLDSREDDGDEKTEEQYSVDSYECGNWTRFINHSCAPNTRVYPVLYDTIPQMKQGYLAFVAIEDIPPRTELTFCYNPAASTALFQGNGKKKPKAPEGALPCFCAAKSCLGWR